MTSRLCIELYSHHQQPTQLGVKRLISQWQGESKERVISLVLTHLPLLKPGNVEAKGEYMRLLPRILAHTIEHGHHLEESRQLLSYALIHPATSLEDRAALALWLNHLEERAAARGDSLERPPPAGPHHHHHQSTPPSTLTSSGSSSSTNTSSSGNLYTLHLHQRYGSDDRLNGWQSSRDSGLGGGWHQQQQGCENGHLLLYPSSSVPATINTVGTGGGGNTILTSGGGSQQHSPLKRSVSLTPPMSGPSNQPLGHVWLSQEDLRTARGPAPDHAPLSPQSSIASSGSGGSEHLEEAGLGGGSGLHRSSFHEEGSGMRECVKTFLLRQLKILRHALHQSCSISSLIHTPCSPPPPPRQSFTETQKKRLLSWKQQVQRLFRSIPRKTILDIAGYRPQRSRFGQSNSLPTAGCVGGSVSVRRSLRQFQMPSRSLPGARLGPLGSGGLLGSTPRSSSSTPTGPKQGRQGLWFANPGGSNSMPSRTHSSVQRTRSLPVHTTPQTMVMFQQADLQLPVTEPDINNRLESLCLSMTEHALGDGADRTSTI
ncbi:protein Smaug homolog 1 [Morone saxatilis]|uniref:protein Smaug homolog 1 n=1 Tax=Morone saxatilis TaxID=34816 RepID=UPI0015E23B23|nr:protein Smaug homolog 1 [Morone saxatilis]